MVISFAIWQRLPVIVRQKGCWIGMEVLEQTGRKNFITRLWWARLAWMYLEETRLRPIICREAILTRMVLWILPVMRHGTFVLRILFLFSIIICVWGLRWWWNSIKRSTKMFHIPPLWQLCLCGMYMVKMALGVSLRNGPEEIILWVGQKPMITKDMG